MISRTAQLFEESFAYKDVFFNLLSQDLKVKYRRTSLGYLWSLLNPLLNLLVLSVIFSQIVKLEMKDYSLYLFSGLLAWTFFQTSVTMASRCFIENEDLIKKIYIPKILLPLTKVCVRGVDFFFGLVALTFIGLLFGFAIQPVWVVSFGAFLPLLFLTLGVSMMAACLTVFFRDVEYFTVVLLQLLYFLTPILYPIKMLPLKYQEWMVLNPVYLQIRLFQSIIYEGHAPSIHLWSTAWGSALFVFLLGLFFLSYCEDKLVFHL